MKFTASLDKTGKIITILCLIIFAVAGYLSISSLFKESGQTRSIYFHILLWIVLIAILVLCYLLAPRSYTLHKDNISVDRLGKNFLIPFTEIDSIRLLTPEEMSGLIRTFGVGGFFGYFGRYYNSKLGHVNLYATQRKNNILIITKTGRKLIITPDDTHLLPHLEKAITSSDHRSA